MVYVWEIVEGGDFYIVCYRKKVYVFFVYSLYMFSFGFLFLESVIVFFDYFYF